MEQQQEEVLTPSYHGELCRHNGENPDYEIACDECDYYLFFPDLLIYSLIGVLVLSIHFLFVDTINFMGWRI